MSTKPVQFVNIHGKTLTQSDFAQQKIDHAPIKKVSESLKRVDTRDEAKASDGFVVTGYSPEHWAERIENHKLAQELFKAGPTKNKAPGTLEEYTLKWVKKNKPKRARSKPYEIQSAADLCADMLRKAGWLHVNVDEILKG